MTAGGTGSNPPPPPPSPAVSAEQRLLNKVTKNQKKMEELKNSVNLVQVNKCMIKGVWYTVDSVSLRHQHFRKMRREQYSQHAGNRGQCFRVRADAWEAFSLFVFCMSWCRECFCSSGCDLNCLIPSFLCLKQTGNSWIHKLLCSPQTESVSHAKCAAVHQTHLEPQCKFSNVSSVS